MDEEYMERSLTNLTPSRDVTYHIEALREKAKDYSAAIFNLVESSPERTLACRKLEESVMWAVKAMCLYDPSSQEQRIGAGS